MIMSACAASASDLCLRAATATVRFRAEIETVGPRIVLYCPRAGRHDQSAVLPQGPGVPAALALFRPGRPAWLRPNAGGGRRPRVAPWDVDGLAYSRARSGFW